MKPLKEFIFESNLTSKVPQPIKNAIESAMKDGWIIMEIDNKEVKFGVSEENIWDLFDYEDCDKKTLEDYIKLRKNTGRKFKYEKNQDWKKLDLEDPLDKKWE